MKTKSLIGTALAFLGLGLGLFAQAQPGTLLWSYKPDGEISASPALGPDGTIYLSTFLGLCAITNAMYRQNLRHTGKVERPALAPLKKRTDGNFDIQLAGEIGQAYSVQSTSNFLNWTSMTNFVATTLPMTISDLTATNSASRFYRATTP